MLFGNVVFKLLQVVLITDKARLLGMLTERNLRLSVLIVLRIYAEQALIGSWLRVIFDLYSVLLCTFESVERLGASEALNCCSFRVAAIANV